MAKKTRKVEYSSDSNKLLRSDAQKNLELILQAALSVFEKSGVDAPVREIAKEAGVGVATLYRHFPERSDLVKAVVQNSIDICAEAEAILSSKHDPEEALAKWMQRLVDLLKTKRGLASALHSGDPAYQALPSYFFGRLKPVLKNLLETAKSAGKIRQNIDADEFLMAAIRVATPASEGDVPQARRMVALLVDGLRFEPDRLSKPM